MSAPPKIPSVALSVYIGRDSNGVAVIEDTVYVAASDAFHLIHNAPVVISLNSESFRVEGETQMSLTFPTPEIPGNYTLKVHNQDESYELPGAVTFAEAPPNSKAIIVAGGGPGDDLWEGFRLRANEAYRALLWQGYTRENIMYLSPEPDIDIDGNGEWDDIDKDATLQNLEEAILTWVNDPENPADDLLIYLTDHGGEGKFRINASETLYAKDSDTSGGLDTWLDEMQKDLPGRLIFVYDACESGSFLPLLTPPDGKERILIASTEAEKPAHYTPLGESPAEICFSRYFWDRVYEGDDLKNAFRVGREAMNDYGQKPLLDADKDGIPNQSGDFSLAEITVGRGYKKAPFKLSVGKVCPEQTLQDETSAALWAEGINDPEGLEAIQAVIIPPNYEPESSDIPVTDLPTIELTDPDGDGRYEGTYDNFTLAGTYRITVYAVSTEGFASLPEETAVVREGKSCIKGDLTGDDNLTLADALLTLKRQPERAFRPPAPHPALT